MRKMIIASTSTLHGGAYLEYLLDELKDHIGNRSVLFIPYARPGGISHDEYTDKVRSALDVIGCQVSGLHEYADATAAVSEAGAIFTGGGNTFLLVSQLYKYNVMNAIADAVNDGTPYLGSSAGSNIAGLTMQTTNDMPIVYPPTFRTLGLLPFNLNPHYLDPIPGSTHMGETRETRIMEFHQFNSTPVLGLREGSWLKVYGDTSELKGGLTARLFRQGKDPIELESGKISIT